MQETQARWFPYSYAEAQGKESEPAHCKPEQTGLVPPSLSLLGTQSHATFLVMCQLPCSCDS